MPRDNILGWARSAEYWRSIPPFSTAIILASIFCLFGCFGILQSLVQYERRGALAKLVWIGLSGGFAVGWALLATRRHIPQMAVLGVVQFVMTIKAGAFINRISTTFDPGSDPALLKRIVLTDVGIGSVLLFGSFLLMSEFQRREGIRYHATHTEMRLATEIHRSLVPEVSLAIGDFEFYGCSRPSGEVGGDVLDVIESKGEWFAYVADVSGHGVAAGVLMSMVKSAARMRLASAGAESFLEKMNDVLAPLSDPAMYATLGCIWPDSNGQLELATAGHLPALHYRPQLRIVQQCSAVNFPIALFNGPLEFETTRVESEPGDVFVLLTDGFTELPNRSGQELGFSSVESLIIEQADRPLREIAKSLYEQAERFGKQVDDQTLLIRRRADAALERNS